MTLRPSLKAPAHAIAPPTAALDPDTAIRLATAAGRQVSGNLFRWLVELNGIDQPDKASDIDDAQGDGPPWSDEPGPYDVPADLPASVDEPADS